MLRKIEENKQQQKIQKPNLEVTTVSENRDSLLNSPFNDHSPLIKDKPHIKVENNLFQQDSD